MHPLRTPHPEKVFPTGRSAGRSSCYRRQHPKLHNCRVWRRKRSRRSAAMLCLLLVSSCSEARECPQAGAFLHCQRSIRVCFHRYSYQEVNNARVGRANGEYHLPIPKRNQILKLGHPVTSRCSSDSRNKHGRSKQRKGNDTHFGLLGHSRPEGGKEMTTTYPSIQDRPLGRLFACDLRGAHIEL